MKYGFILGIMRPVVDIYHLAVGATLRCPCNCINCWMISGGFVAVLIFYSRYVIKLWSGDDGFGATVLLWKMADAERFDKSTTGYSFGGVESSVVNVCVS